MKKVHLIHHTHWDYEWYFTENESQVQLNYHVNELLDYINSNQVTNYHLDGQTSIIESWLKDNPDLELKLKQEIENKNIFTGPWYTQSDQFLVRAQSLNKNLELGMEKTKELGGTVDYAYVVDAFGQNLDLINIYLENNINKLVFWRGVDPKKIKQTRFIWEHNEQQIEVINLPYGYYYGYLLNDYQELEKFIKKFEHEFPEDQIVVPIGGDQRAVDYQINQLVTKYNQEQTEYQFVVSNYQNLFAEEPKQPLNIFNGEMLNGARSKIHRSISSTRVDHKQLNNYCENLLIHQVMPLVVMAGELGLNTNQTMIDNLWRELLKNHTHDSICGCNSDITNYHITNRYQTVIEKAESIIDYLVRKITEANAQANQLFVYNTLSFTRNIQQQYLINTKDADFKIINNNDEVPYQIIKQEHVYHGSLTMDNFNPEMYHYETLVEFKLEVQGFGLEQLTIIENEKVTSSEFQVPDLQSELNNFSLVFSSDAGDNYDYSPGEDNQIIECLANTAKQVTKNQFSLKVMLPEDEEAWKTMTNLIEHELLISLSKEKEIVNYQIEFINKVKEFRMQVKWLNPITKDYHYAEGPFSLQKRLNIDSNINNWQNDGWAEEPTSIYPVINTINFNNDCNIILNGTKEYQVNDNYLYITLMRSINYLGKPNLKRRPGKASGQEFKWVETPDSQMLGKITFKFAYFKSKKTIEIKKVAQSIQNQYCYYQIQDYNRFTGRLKYFTSNINRNLKIKEQQIINLNLPDQLLLLSISKRNSGYQLEVLNCSNQAINYRNQLIVGKQYKKIYLEEL